MDKRWPYTGIEIEKFGYRVLNGSNMSSNNEERKRRNDLRRELIDKFPRDRSYLLPALHFLQEKFSYLPDWGLEVLGWHLGVPASEVYGTATTYTELLLSPPAQKTVSVCDGVACRENGATQILEFLSNKTNSDLKVQKTDCAFMCSVAPAVSVNHRWFGRQVPGDVLLRLIEN